MGAVSSKNVAVQVSKSVNESITKFLINNAQNCTANSSQEFNLNISDGSVVDVGGNIAVAQSFASGIKCMQEDMNQTDLANALAAQIKQAAEQAANTAAGIFASKISMTSSDVSNVVNTHLDLNQIQTCATNAIQTVNIDVSSDSKLHVGGDIRVKQQAQALVDCIKKSKMVTDMSNDVSSKVTQKVSQTGFSIWTYLIIGAVIIAVLVVAGRIYSSYSEGSEVDAYVASLSEPTEPIIGGGLSIFSDIVNSL